MPTVMIAAAAVTVAAMLALWVASVRLRDVSIVDVYWGPGFAVIAWTSIAVAGASPRGLLAASLATAWGGRLGVHLARRRRGHGEDRRYAAMRAAHGDRFPLVSLFTVFLLQAALLWIVSLPLQAAASDGGRLGPLDAAGAALCLAGIAIESTADTQLTRFLARPGSGGRVMDEGLWRWSRHPNYFGDAVVWWGLGLVGAAAGAPWTLVGAVVMTVLLLKVSGVELLESTIGARRPGYAEYAARTSAFVPWPPSRRTRGRTYVLESEQLVRRCRPDVFAFFADAENLDALTPGDLRFEIVTERPIAMHAGALIAYRLRVAGVPFRWLTRIEVFDVEERFVDVQLRGPYRSWRHTHVFAEVPGGTLVRDRVEYELPLGPIGALAHALFVRSRLERILAYRRRRIAELLERGAGSLA